MNRTDLQQLAESRVSEAGALLASPVPLKACIAKSYGAEEWPEKGFVQDCHTHEILKLVKLAALDSAADVAANSNLGNYWNVVKDWSERSRYECHSHSKAQDLFEAITHSADGVLPWIRNHW